MASDLDICNAALTKVGANQITSRTENSAGAKAVNAVYDRKRKALLRKHPWSFAIKRASLAQDANPPLFNRTYQYQLPSDWLRLLAPDPEVNFNDCDWEIEGRYIITNYLPPLQIRYIWDVTDVNLMDALFQEALATDIALEICEKLTQSNTKKADLKDDLKEIIQEARRTNAIEVVAQTPPEDTFITVRR